MKRASLALSVALLCACMASPAQAQSSFEAPGVWTNQSALVPTQGHARLALLHESSVGVHERIALTTHVLGLLAPHVAVLGQVFARYDVHVAARLGLAYVTPFLSLVSREGAGGLLPPDTTPPQAFLIDTAVRVSWTVLTYHVVTLASSLSIAAQGQPHQPLLDFPFLYSRFAALDSDFAPSVRLSAEGALPFRLRYHGGLAYTFIDTPEPGFALEHQVSLGVALGRAILEAGYLSATARYPVGVRTHTVPVLDVRVAW